jgi:hypothetical protein
VDSFVSIPFDVLAPKLVYHRCIAKRKDILSRSVNPIYQFKLFEHSIRRSRCRRTSVMTLWSFKVRG